MKPSTQTALDEFLAASQLKADVPAGVGFTVRDVIARGHTETAARTAIDKMLKAGKAKEIGRRRTAKVYQMVK